MYAIRSYYDLVTHPEFLYVNELKLIQALSYVALCENESALTFLNALEGEPLFGEPYSTTIQNRIIFEKYWLLYNLPDDPSHQMAAEYVITSYSIHYTKLYDGGALAIHI